ncbi:MAG: hypothetical protein OXI54_13680 [Chloroflexota bacterium]|nr:hypothetical protein [Chloroflexota bacterium]MDE2685180.1 hypothetical protein [Chloroflexota bacterium]
MSNLADIIAQETQDGRLIVRFLLSAMDGDLPDFQPCHRIDAARLLVKLGFDQAQAVIDRARDAQRAAAQRTPNRDSRSQPQPETRWLFDSASESETQSAANSIRDQLAQIVREETDDGRVAVRFLIDAMQGEFPDFKPCHRPSAARELLQRGFDYVPDDADPQAEPEPAELTPEALEARRRAELIEFSKHGPGYYQIHPFPCVCEDRLHDCDGNPLNDEQLEAAARRSPSMEHFIDDPDQMNRFLARYAEYLTTWNAEHPRNPIDINRIIWTHIPWRHLNHRPRAP